SALQQAMEQVPQLCLVICCPPGLVRVFALPQRRLFQIDPLPFGKFMQVASIADFSLAPLRLDAFNECKSEIRILESAMWRVPCIASPAAPYRRFHEKSGGACLLAEENDPRQWTEHIVRLATDAALRRELGERARRAVEIHYDLSTQNKKR